MRVKVLPKRQKGKPLDWDSEEPIEFNYLNSVDINNCIKHGAQVDFFADK